jgi:hypothetical protein
VTDFDSQTCTFDIKRPVILKPGLPEKPACEVYYSNLLFFLNFVSLKKKDLNAEL